MIISIKKYQILRKITKRLIKSSSSSISICEKNLKNLILNFFSEFLFELSVSSDLPSSSYFYLYFFRSYPVMEASQWGLYFMWFLQGHISTGNLKSLLHKNRENLHSSTPRAYIFYAKLIKFFWRINGDKIFHKQ